MNTRLKKKLSNHSGFSLAEMLTAMLILLLVTGLLTATVKLAAEQYDKSMRTSQSKLLCSTLETVISNELAFTTNIVTDDSGNLVKFQSPNYAMENNLSMFMNDGAAGNFGRIIIGDPDNSNQSMNLLGQAAYNRKLYANVESVKYDADKFCFTVKLVISYKDQEFLSETFDVLNVNHTKPN